MQRFREIGLGLWWGWVGTAFLSKASTRRQRLTRDSGNTPKPTTTTETGLAETARAELAHGVVGAVAPLRVGREPQQRAHQRRDRAAHRAAAEVDRRRELRRTWPLHRSG